MAVLNDWQRLDRFFYGLPFGNGSDGDTTISSNPNTRTTCTGTADSPNLTVGSTAFSNGDFVLLHQTREGTSPGKWEINQVASGGGTTSLVMTKDLTYTYASGAQIIGFSLYNNVTIGSHTITSWNGSIGGIEVICARVGITVSGTVTGTGSNGANAVSSGGGATGAGFYGANGVGKQGEGTGGARDTHTNTANGSGGGGGKSDGGNNAGAGGGAGAGANNGTPGNYQPGGSTAPGAGGGAVGSTDGIKFSIGGGGGSGEGSVNSGAGGSGASTLVLISRSITVTGAINLRGGKGGEPQDPLTGGHVNWGGGGGGGVCLMICQTPILGSSLINVTKQDTNAGTYSQGGNGNVIIQYSDSISGSSSPSYNANYDPTLIEIPVAGQVIL